MAAGVGQAEVVCALMTGSHSSVEELEVAGLAGGCLFAWDPVCWACPHSLGPPEAIHMSLALSALVCRLLCSFDPSPAGGSAR